MSANTSKKFKKDDKVIVIAGKCKGETGIITKVLEDNRVLVSGVNKVKKHKKANPQTNEPGGIVEIEAPLQISNVAILDPESGKAAKVGFKIEVDADGNKTKTRVLKSSGQAI